MTAEDDKRRAAQAREDRLLSIERRLDFIEQTSAIKAEREFAASNLAITRMMQSNADDRAAANKLRLDEARDRAKRRPRVKITVAPRPGDTKPYDWQGSVTAQRVHYDGQGNREHLHVRVGDAHPPILMRHAWEKLLVDDPGVKQLHKRGVLVVSDVPLEEATMLEVERPSVDPRNPDKDRLY